MGEGGREGRREGETYLLTIPPISLSGSATAARKTALGGVSVGRVGCVSVWRGGGGSGASCRPVPTTVLGGVCVVGRTGGVSVTVDTQVSRRPFLPFLTYIVRTCIYKYRYLYTCTRTVKY